MMFEHWQRRLKAINAELNEMYTEMDESGVYNTHELNKLSEALQTLENELSDMDSKHEQWVRRNHEIPDITPDGSTWESHY